MGNGFVNDDANLVLMQELGWSVAAMTARLQTGLSPDELMQQVFFHDVDTGNENMLRDAQYAMNSALYALRSWRNQLLTGGIQVSSFFGAEYPEHVREIHDAPGVLFWQGQFSQNDFESVAIVGTRTPSKPAAAFTHQLASLLSERHIPIVSGLARGVDTIALETSLQSGNRTIGVIGTGLNVSYPPENAALQSAIAADHVLLSQFTPDQGPTKWTFPARNVVTSGFSMLSAVVEAGEYSGTRTHVKAALGHGRPVILTNAVVQQTQWAKNLVTNGANITVVTTAEEAIDAVTDIRHNHTAQTGRFDFLKPSLKTLEPAPLRIPLNLHTTTPLPIPITQHSHLFPS